MKKQRKQRTKNFISALSFFIMIAVIMQIAILIYDYISDRTENPKLIAVLILILILILSVIVCVIDYFRRKIMVDKPVNKILEATQKISNGEFDLPIEITRNYSDFNKYDIIMDNVNKMAKELKKSEILKSDFISNVSHEIKTPLSIIGSYANALKDGSLDDETRNKYLDTLITATKRLSDLISDILKLNKLENQSLDVKKEKFLLTDALSEIVLEFEELTENKRIEIELDVDDVYIYSSKSLINIIIYNLFSNAVKFSFEKGKIFISLKKQGEIAELTIKDTGVGIAPDTGKNIFEKFYQGDTSHRSEGNGLGLALVKKVIDILGGEISVESELNIGSTFTVKLKGALDE